MENVISGPKISILLPSRGRPENILRLLKSISLTTSSLTSIEVLVYLDDDDFETNENDFQQFAFVTFFRGPRVWISLAHNYLYIKSCGDILMAASDDFIFRTTNWDQVIADEYENAQDQPLLVFGNDLGTHAGKIPTHFFLNRVWPKKLGYWLPVQRSGLWDLWIYELANQVECVKYRADLVFEHAHYRHSKNPKFRNKLDSTAIDILRVQDLIRPMRTYRLLKRERVFDAYYLNYPIEYKPKPKLNFLLSRLVTSLFRDRIQNTKIDKLRLLNNRELILTLYESLISKVMGFWRKFRRV